MTEIRPATLQDFERLKGRPPKTARAFAAVRDDAVIGIGGVYRGGVSLVLFSELTDAIRKDKRTLARLVRAVKSLMKGTVYAHADEAIAGSEVLLEHMGFEPFQGRLYQWHG